MWFCYCKKANRGDDEHTLPLTKETCCKEIAWIENFKDYFVIYKTLQKKKKKKAWIEKFKDYYFIQNDRYTEILKSSLI